MVGVTISQRIRKITRQYNPMMMSRIELCWTLPSASFTGPKQQASGNATCGRRIAAATAAVLLMNATPLLVNAADVAVYDHDKTLAGADFSNRDLRGAIFTKAVCKKALFKNAILDNAMLDDADVRTPF